MSSLHVMIFLNFIAEIYLCLLYMNVCYTQQILV